MPLVIPIFIPHEGCPHCCVFCNQRGISGFVENTVSAQDVQRIIREWLDRDNGRAALVQVAFYGGSFTGLPVHRQQELLDAVAPFIAHGQVAGIRLSTRPDYIDTTTVDFLKTHHVTIVELGVQSMVDSVLTAAGRGHLAADVDRAMAILRGSGLETGIQLMVGLPRESRSFLRYTVDRVIALCPDFVRIYPVLVVKNSKLAELYSQGRFQPLTLGKAVILTAWMKNRFDDAGIRVVRMGLQAGKELESSFIAGPWHPGFGELVLSRLMFNKVRKLLADRDVDTPVKLSISSQDESVFRGMKSQNIIRLQQLNLANRFTLLLTPGQQRQTVILIA